ncbi:amino acid transporter [Gonapodya prolifera JEL478]|uniref:Amino acid transporter n=1 Tax=Gonapodya prolifera (strain JEL478) TaxID=1344416 RepID=A0A138ZXH2_GONPJ|nr:amino acid transporter [Gonapodya prolifera JEL478]|eukprot:KXS09200.1 amino acid transporter [Gonapodya prolifera JEL478]
MVAEQEKQTPIRVASTAPLALGNQRIKRRIGWFEGGLFNVGMIIGVGIFSNPTLILRYGGSTGISLVLWIIGGLVAAAGLWAFTELGTTIPRSGGEKEYLAYAYPKPKKLLSYLFAVNGLIILRGAGIANTLIVFGNYLNYAIYGPTYSSDYGARAWALAALTIIAAINILSVPLAIRLNTVVTSYKIILVTFVVLVGFAAIVGAFPNANIPGLVANLTFADTSNAPSNYANAIYYVRHAYNRTYAYNGWANVNYILDEVHEPVKNLPKAAIFSLSTTTALYIFANLAYFAVLTKDEILNSNLTVAATFFTKTFGGTFGSNVLPGVIALSPFGLASVILYTGSRVVLETSREGLLPFADWFNYVHPKTNSPIYGILLIYVLSVIFLFAPPPGQAFSFIVSFSGYTGYLFYFFALIGIYIIRRREPDLYRPIKAPLAATGLFAIFSAYQFIFTLVPPTKVTTSYPYYLPYVISIVVLVITIGLWYLQVVVFKGLENSYNARIAVDAEKLVAQEVFHVEVKDGNGVKGEKEESV